MSVVVLSETSVAAVWGMSETAVVAGAMRCIRQNARSLSVPTTLGISAIARPPEWVTTTPRTIPPPSVQRVEGLLQG